MCIPVVLYMVMFIVNIGVFGDEVTRNLIFPTVELAKGVRIPGEFFKRFESGFFMIWILAFFNTTKFAIYVAVFAFTSIFKNTSKHQIIFILSLLVYLTAMYPQNILEVSTYGVYVGYAVIAYTGFLVVLLWGVGKLRGVKPID